MVPHTGTPDTGGLENPNLCSPLTEFSPCSTPGSVWGSRSPGGRGIGEDVSPFLRQSKTCRAVRFLSVCGFASKAEQTAVLAGCRGGRQPRENREPSRARGRASTSKAWSALTTPLRARCSGPGVLRDRLHGVDELKRPGGGGARRIRRCQRCGVKLREQELRRN